jgi:hypothetical protein
MSILQCGRSAPTAVSRKDCRVACTELTSEVVGKHGDISKPAAFSPSLWCRQARLRHLREARARRRQRGARLWRFPRWPCSGRSATRAWHIFNGFSAYTILQSSDQTSSCSSKTGRSTPDSHLAPALDALRQSGIFSASPPLPPSKSLPSPRARFRASSTATAGGAYGGRNYHGGRNYRCGRRSRRRDGAEVEFDGASRAAARHPYRPAECHRRRLLECLCACAHATHASA